MNKTIEIINQIQTQNENQEQNLKLKRKKLIDEFNFEDNWCFKKKQWTEEERWRYDYYCYGCKKNELFFKYTHTDKPFRIHQIVKKEYFKIGYFGKEELWRETLALCCECVNNWEKLKTKAKWRDLADKEVSKCDCEEFIKKHLEKSIHKVNVLTNREKEIVNLKNELAAMKEQGRILTKEEQEMIKKGRNNWLSKFTEELAEEIKAIEESIEAAKNQIEITKKWELKRQEMQIKKSK